MQITVERLVKAYRSMCTIRMFKERVHKEYVTEQILGFVHSNSSTYRGHSHSIDEGGES